MPADEVPDELLAAHLVGRAQTGHATSAITGDPIVTLTLWALDVARPGNFALFPTAARDLARALLDSADQAEASS